jgi:hypothetical protein
MPLCCSGVLVGTNRMLALATASHFSELGWCATSVRFALKSGRLRPYGHRDISGPSLFTCT